jgi:hypothetical protein
MVIQCQAVRPRAVNPRHCRARSDDSIESQDRPKLARASAENPRAAASNSETECPAVGARVGGGLEPIGKDLDCLRVAEQLVEVPDEADVVVTEAG